MTSVAKLNYDKQVNKTSFQGAANTTADYTGGLVGGQAQEIIKRMRERVNRPQSSNMDPTTVQPADATRMHKPY